MTKNNVKRKKGESRGENLIGIRHRLASAGPRQRQNGGAMKTRIRGLRALVSVLLLGLGLNAYAARLDPVGIRITTLGFTGSEDFNPADACDLPCSPPHLDGNDRPDGAGDVGLIR
jgi:hypothetical protein